MKSLRISTGILLFAFLSASLFVTIANSQDTKAEAESQPAPTTALLDGKFVDLQAYLQTPEAKAGADAGEDTHETDASADNQANRDASTRTRVRTLGFETNDRLYVVTGTDRELDALTKEWFGKHASVEIKARVIEKKQLQALAIEDVSPNPGS